VSRREAKEHYLWENAQTGHAEAVPRQSKIASMPATKNVSQAVDPGPPG